MVRSATLQCFVTPFIIPVVLGIVIPSKDRLTGVVTIVSAAIGIGMCVIPACVVAMLHAGLSANYLNEMSGFYLGGTFGGTLLAALYVLKIKGKMEPETKVDP